MTIRSGFQCAHWSALIATAIASTVIFVRPLISIADASHESVPGCFRGDERTAGKSQKSARRKNNIGDGL